MSNDEETPYSQYKDPDITTAQSISQLHPGLEEKVYDKFVTSSATAHSLLSTATVSRQHLLKVVETFTGTPITSATQKANLEIVDFSASVMCYC